MTGAFASVLTTMLAAIKVFVIALGAATVVAALLGGAEGFVLLVAGGLGGFFHRSASALTPRIQTLAREREDARQHIVRESVPAGQVAPRPWVAICIAANLLSLGVFTALSISDLEQTLAVLTSLTPDLDLSTIPLPINGGWIAAARATMVVMTVAGSSALVFEGLGMSSYRPFHRLPTWFRRALVAIGIVQAAAMAFVVGIFFLYVPLATGGHADVITPFFVAAMLICGAASALTVFATSAFLYMAAVSIWYLVLIVLLRACSFIQFLLREAGNVFEFLGVVLADVARRLPSFPAARRSALPALEMAGGTVPTFDLDQEALMSHPTLDLLEVGRAGLEAKILEEAVEIGSSSAIRSAGGYNPDGTIVAIPAPIKDTQLTRSELDEIAQHAGQDEREAARVGLQMLENKYIEEASNSGSSAIDLGVSIGIGVDQDLLEDFCHNLKRRRGSRAKLIGIASDPALRDTTEGLHLDGTLETTLVVPTGGKQRLIAHAIAAMADIRAHNRDNTDLGAVLAELPAGPFVRLETASLPVAATRIGPFGRSRGAVVGDAITQTGKLVRDLTPGAGDEMELGVMLVLAPIAAGRGNWWSRLIGHTEAAQEDPRRHFADTIRSVVDGCRPRVKTIIAFVNGATVPCGLNAPLFCQAVLLTPTVPEAAFGFLLTDMVTAPTAAQDGATPAGAAAP